MASGRSQKVFIKEIILWEKEQKLFNQPDTLMRIHYYNPRES